MTQLSASDGPDFSFPPLGAPCVVRAEHVRGERGPQLRIARSREVDPVVGGAGLGLRGPGDDAPGTSHRLELVVERAARGLCHPSFTRDDLLQARPCGPTTVPGSPREVRGTEKHARRAGRRPRDATEHVDEATLVLGVREGTLEGLVGAVRDHDETRGTVAQLLSGRR